MVSLGETEPTQHKGPVRVFFIFFVYVVAARSNTWASSPFFFVGSFLLFAFPAVGSSKIGSATRALFL